VAYKMPYGGQIRCHYQ